MFSINTYNKKSLVYENISVLIEKYKQLQFVIRLFESILVLINQRQKTKNVKLNKLLDNEIHVKS